MCSTNEPLKELIWFSFKHYSYQTICLLMLLGFFIKASFCNQVKKNLVSSSYFSYISSSLLLLFFCKYTKKYTKTLGINHFFDKLLSNNFIPQINPPTKVSKTAATLIVTYSLTILNTNVSLAILQPKYLIIYHSSQSLKMQKISLSTKLTIQSPCMISDILTKIFSRLT